MKANHQLVVKGKTTVKLKSTLFLAGAGFLFTAFLIVGALLFQVFADNPDAKAGTSSHIQLLLFPRHSTEVVKNNIQADLSYSSDSLFIDMFNPENTVLKNSSINIFDLDQSTDGNFSPKTLAFSNGRKTIANHIIFSIAFNQLPEKIMIEATSGFNTAKKQASETTKEITEVVNRIKFNSKNFSFMLPPSGLQVNSVTVKSATASWTPVKDAFKYRFRFRKTGEEVWKMGTVLAPGNQRPMVNLEAGSGYEFQVQAYTRNQIIDSTGYSSIATFSTAR